MSSPDVVVVFSAGSRTGGPECCFQLVHELTECLQIDARVWLINPMQQRDIEEGC